MIGRAIRGTLAAASRHVALVAEEKAVPSGGAVIPAAVKSKDGGGGGGGGGGGSGGGDTVGKRLLSLVFEKRSAVIAINKWKEEGHKVQKYQLNRVVRELRKLKRYKHALEACEWMTTQQDLKLLPGDFAVHLDLIAKVRGLASAEKFFEDLPESMRGCQTCSALLHAYVQNKLVDKAEALMEKMCECNLTMNPLPFNHLISLYIANGQFEKVPHMVKELKKKAKPDIVTYNLLLGVCSSKNDIETAEQLLKNMKKEKIDPDWVTLSTFSNLYIKMERLEKAAFTLKEMEKKASRQNRIAYSSLLSLHTNMKDKDGLQRIWNKMKSLFRKLSNAEYTCMVASLARLGEIEEALNIYTEWESSSGNTDPRVPNTLLGAYISRTQIEEAEIFHNRMVQRGISSSYTTWELLTWGHLKRNDLEKVLEYFERAVTSVKKWDPDERLVREIFKNIEEQGNIGGAERFLVTLRNAGYMSTEIYNFLLRTYAKAGKMPLLVIERMTKDSVELDEETEKLIETTSRMCVSEVPSILS